MTIEFGEVNRYDQASTFPAVDLIFTGPKKSLVDRVSGKSLQFTRNTTGTYVDANGIIQTSAAGEPRYTYDPVTGEELGLLVEESRTNLQFSSSDYTTNYWDFSFGITKTPNATIAPDGTLTATLIQQDTTDTIHVLGGGYGFNSGYITLNTTYTLSLYVKYYNSNKIRFMEQQTYSGSTNGSYTKAGVIFNFETESIEKTIQWNGSSQSLIAGYKVDKLPDGWYRLSLSVIPGSDYNNQRVYFGVYPQEGNLSTPQSIPSGAVGIDGANYSSLTSVTNFVGDGSTGVYIWGAQVEAGSSSTSYIPTTSSTVTRDPDTVTLTNDNLYNNLQFDIINDPFGMSAGSDTLTLLSSNSENSAIKRATIFSPNIAQNNINSFAGKTDEFWRWRVKGDSFGLPTYVQSDGDMTIDWGDGTIEEYDSAFLAGSNAITHTYTDGKEYHEIGFRLDSGTYFRPRLYQDGNSRPKLIAIGPAPENMKVDLDAAFRDCVNLEAIDPTFIAGGGSNNASSAFRGCAKLKSFPKIDTSNIGSFNESWIFCSDLENFPLIDTSSGTNFTLAWRSCGSLTEFPEIDTSSGTSFIQTWHTCSSLTSFPKIDTSSGTNFSNTWYGCSSLTEFPEIDTSSGTIFSSTWGYCSNLITFPLIDTSSSTNFSKTWRNCNSLTEFPLIDTSSGTNFDFTWQNCSNLTTFPQIDTSSATSLSYTWYGCSGLTEFPEIDTSSATSLSHTWFGCSGLTEFPEIDTSGVTELAYTWANCTSLTSFPFIDVNNCTYFAGTWRICSSLTDFPANLFDSWSATPYNGCFSGTWLACPLTSTSLENIINSISISPSSFNPPPINTEITIDYDASSGTPDITIGTIDLIAKGWIPTLNGSAKTDPYSDEFVTLDLDFATNKTLVDNVSGDDLITFSRNSTATYVDENGIIKYAENQNWSPNSEKFSAWTSVGLQPFGSGSVSNAIAAPNSTQTADLLVEDTGTSAHGVNTSFALTLNETYTYSVYVKKQTSSYDYVAIGQSFGPGGAFYKSIIRLTDGFVESSSDPTTVDNVGDGWYRVKITFVNTYSTPRSIQIYLQPTSTYQSSYQGDGTSGLYVWGAQVELGSVATDYAKTYAQGRYTPRFDHDPETNESLGLLVEEARTNKSTYSEYFEYSSNSNAIVITNTQIAPDGTFTADTLQTTSSGNARYARMKGSVTTTSIYTASVFVKAGTTNYFQLAFSSGGAYANFDLGLGVVGTSGGGLYISHDITPVGNGWYRCHMVFTSPGSGVVWHQIVESSSAANLPFWTPTGSETIHLWGSQLEVGSFPTSYIPTPATFTSRNSTATYYDANGTIQTAAIDVARDDAYLPDENGTFYPTGLLLEDAATNGVVRSNTWGGGIPHVPGGPNTGVINDGKYQKVGVTHNYGVAPDGTLTSLKLGDIGQHAISSLAVDISIYGVNEPSATINTFSTFVRKIGNTDTFTIISHTSMNTSISFTFSTETFNILYAPWYISGSEGYQKLSNGWYRIWWSYDRTLNGLGTETLWAKISSADPTFELEIWGAQKNAGLGVSSYVPSIEDFTSRSSTATYYDANGIIQTAAIDVARDDAHLPDENDVFRPIGTLIENYSINFTTNSENASVWGDIGGQTTNVSNDVIDAPDGNTTADLIYGGSGNWTALSILSGNTLLSINHYIIASVFVKKVPGSKYGFINLNVNAVGSGNPRINLNLDTGETITYGGVSGYAEKLPNGWYRLVCSVRNTSGANQTWTANSIRIFAATSSTDEQGTGTGTGSTTDGVYVWGRQVEINSLTNLPTSYIPTAGSTLSRSSDVVNATYGSRAADVSSSSTVTRAADVASITGTNFSSWYNQSEGTFQGIGKQTYTTPNQFESLIVGGSVPNRSWSWAMLGSIGRWQTGTDGLESGYFYTGLTPNVPFDFNVIQAQSSTSAALAADGVIGASGSRSVDLYNISTLSIGSNYDGTIKRLSYWPKRLTDTSLQYLTQ